MYISTKRVLYEYFKFIHAYYKRTNPELERKLSRRSIYHTSMRTQVQIPRIHKKLGVVSHFCNSRTPMVRWKTETGEFLEAHRPANLTRDQPRNPFWNNKEGKDQNSKWSSNFHMAAVAYTYVHTKSFFFF